MSFDFRFFNVFGVFCIEGVALFGIWENGSVFWDFSGDSIWHSIDGWVAAYDAVPKCQSNCKGMMLCACLS